MINTEIREILINFNYRIIINNLKINFFNTNNDKFLLSNISIKFRFILFTSLIIITGLLIINTSPNQLIQVKEITILIQITIFQNQLNKVLQINLIMHLVIRL